MEVYCRYKRTRSCEHSQQQQQTTKLRNVVVMNDDGEFRLFLPQSYLATSNKTGGQDKERCACRKQSCPAFRKVSSISWTQSTNGVSSGRHLGVDHAHPTRTPNRLVRCKTSVEEDERSQFWIADLAGKYAWASGCSVWHWKSSLWH